MSLRSIVIPKLVVPIDSEQVFTVSGVSANQVFTLYQRHREDLATLFNNFAGKVETSAVINSIEGIIAQFPVLVGEVIAIASGGSPFDEERMEDGRTGWETDLSTATRLPMPVQVDALMKIGELTFSPDMPPKKFFALLVGMIQQLNNAKPTLEVSSDS